MARVEIRRTALIVAFGSALQAASAQAPSIEWQKSFGGTQADVAYAVTTTDDGGYLVAGQTASNNFSVAGNHGGIDIWVIRLSASGDSIWQKTFGGTGEDRAQDITRTGDGNYVIAGTTSSQDGDVTGAHGGLDYWVIKIDGDGTLLWQKALGGTLADEARSVKETADGGLIVVGWSGSAVSGAHGLDDAWVVKLFSNGATDWSVALGGSNYDGFYSIDLASTGGYIAAGYSYSSNGDVATNHGNKDCWVVRLNDFGEIIWEGSYGGSDIDAAYCAQETSDGGFAVTGQSFSVNGDVLGNHGSSDAWLFKLSSTGGLQWQQTLGGSNNDGFWAVSEMADGDLVAAGWELSTDGGDVVGNHGNYDFWIVRASSSGDLIWQKPIGGTGVDGCNAFAPLSDGGYILVGESYSNNGDATLNRGANDFWITKLSQGGVGIAEVNPLTASATAYPNPSNGILMLQYLAQPIAGELIVFDSKGSIAERSLLPSRSSKCTMTIKNPGLYLCQLRWGVSVSTVRVVVE